MSPDSIPCSLNKPRRMFCSTAWSVGPSATVAKVSAIRPPLTKNFWASPQLDHAGTHPKVSLVFHLHAASEPGYVGLSCAPHHRGKRYKAAVRHLKGLNHQGLPGY